MGDAYSKERRMPSSESSTSLRQHVNQFFQVLPRTTQCDVAPPPPPLPLDSLPPPPPPSSSSTSKSTTSSAPPPPPPGSSEEAARITAAAEAVAPVANPGPYENAVGDVRRILQPETHDGFRCDISKQLNPFMAVTHSFWLGTSIPADGRTNTYNASAQVASEQGVLMARFDPTRGSVDGRVVSSFPFPFRLQLNVSQDAQNDSLLAEVDFGRDTWMANLKYGSMGHGLVFGCNYFQSITPRLAVGGEGMYIAANGNAISSYTVKYTMPAKTGEEDSPFSPALNPSSPSPSSSSTLAPPLSDNAWKGSSMFCANLNLSQSVATLSYLRVVTPSRVTLAAELQFNPLSIDQSQVMVGAEFRLSRSKLATAVDGWGRIQSVVETKLDKAPGSPSLSLSADVDHAKETLRFGYGLTLEG